MNVADRIPSPAADEEQVAALVGRLFVAGVGAFELLSMHLGVELGLYRALADGGPSTPPELASAAGIDIRYAREWLEQQAIAELIEVDSPAAPPDERRYALGPAGQAVLLDESSLAHIAPMGAFVVSLAQAVPTLVEAYRSGAGVPFADYGGLLRRAMAAFNRPGYQNLLTTTWIPDGLPEVHQRLRGSPPARVADLGCGAGWSAIALAQGYPSVRVDGFDLDRASIEEARTNAAQVGVADRVSFVAADAADAVTAGSYDLVTVFEALHDMSRPVDVLRAARSMLGPHGCVLVADERVADEFGAFGDPVERFMYGASVLHCLPVGLADRPSAGTGTVMRTSTLDRYARQAGFTTVEVLPIDHDFFRFYRLAG